jgi:hypothetical protein
MGMNAFGSPSAVGLIERMLGPAYHSIKVVADHIDILKTLATNIADVKDAARNKARAITTIEDQAGALGSTTYIGLPFGLAETSIMDVQVVLVSTGVDKPLYSESSGHFTSRTRLGFVEVALKAGAPAELAGAEIRVTVFHKI